MKNYKQWVSENQPLEEDFKDSMKQGFSQQYAQSRGDTTGDQDFEKYAQKALPIIQKAGGIAQSYAQKVGIPLPFATALIASGLIGGPAAIPFAALMYFVRKPVNKLAGAAFDKAANLLGANSAQQPPPLPTRQPPPLPTQQPPPLQPQLAWHDLKFSSYESYRDLNEGYFQDKVDQIGGVVGKAAGFVAGKTTRYSANIKSVLSKSWGGLTQFVSQNKLSITKAAFLMGVGAVIGAGIGKITHDAIDSITQAIGDQGLSAEEMKQLNWLRHEFKMDTIIDKEGDFHAGDSDTLFGVDRDKITFDKDGAEIAISADTFDNTQSVGDAVKKVFGDAIQSQEVNDPNTAAGVLTYRFEITPKPGENAQSMLQNAYRTLAKELAQKDIQLTDLKVHGQDPSGAIQAMLSVAPNLTAPGAVGGAMAMSQQNKPQQNVRN